MVAAISQNKSPWLVTPCLGARSFAATQDDELWLGLSTQHIGMALDAMEQNGLRYPPAVDQAMLQPPLKDHIVSRLMARPE